MDNREQIIILLDGMKRETSVLVSLLSSLMLDTGKYDYTIDKKTVESLEDYRLSYSYDGETEEFKARVHFPGEELP